MVVDDELLQRGYAVLSGEITLNLTPRSIARLRRVFLPRGRERYMMRRARRHYRFRK